MKNQSYILHYALPMFFFWITGTSLGICLKFYLIIWSYVFQNMEGIHNIHQQEGSETGKYRNHKPSRKTNSTDVWVSAYYFGC